MKEGQGDNVIFKLTNCPVKESGDISKLLEQESAVQTSRAGVYL